MLKRLAAVLAATIMLLLFIRTTCPAKEVPPGRWWHLPYFANRLNITEHQKDQLDKLFDENRNRLAQLKKQVEEERNALVESIDREDLNERSAMAKMKQLERTRTLLAATRFTYSLEVRKLLGYERFERLKTLFRNWHGLQRYSPAEGVRDLGLGRPGGPDSRPGTGGRKGGAKDLGGRQGYQDPRQ